MPNFSDELEQRIEQAIQKNLDSFAQRVADVRRREPALTEADVDLIVGKAVGRIFGVDVEREPHTLRDAVTFAVSARSSISKMLWIAITGFVTAAVGTVLVKLGMGK